MVSLNAFVMIDSTLDIVVKPEQSGCFGFWANNSNTGTRSLLICLFQQLVGDLTTGSTASTNTHLDALQRWSR